MTVLGGKRVAPRKPLKRGTPIKRTKGLSKVSAKQRTRNTALAKIEPPTDGLCQKCHRPPDFRGLSKHHKRFRSRGGTDAESNLIWLCGFCHSQEHGIREIREEATL